MERKLRGGGKQMKRIKKLSFLLLTLCAVFSLLTFSAAAWDNDFTLNPELILNPQTRLSVFVDGTANHALSGDYPYGEAVELNAPSVASKTFLYWTNDEGTIISYSSTLKVKMYANTTLSAIYGSSASTAQTTAAFLNVSRTDGEIVFNAIAKANGSITETGIRYSTTKSSLEDLKGTDGVTVEKADDSTANWTLIVTPADETTTYYAVVYTTVGSETTYSAVKAVKLSELQSAVSPIINLGELNGVNVDFCNVTFNANGGEGTMLPQGMVKNTATPLNANTYTRSGYTFNGWSTTATGSVVYSDGQTVTLSGDTTLYAQWRSNSSSTSGGGIPTPTPTTETITIPVSGEGKDAETVNATVQVSGSTATVTSADVDKVLEAKDVGNVTVDVSSLSSLNSSVDEVVLPAEMVKKVADAVADKGNDASGLEIKLPTGTVTLDAMTVATLAQQSNGKNLKVHLNKVSETALNNAQQSTVKALNALVVLDAYVTADGKRISNFNGGTATFSVPVELKDGQVPAGVAAFFVDDNGEMIEIPCSYDSNTATATGTVEHFSNYVVTYDVAKAQKAAEEAKTVDDAVKALDALPAAADVKIEDKEAIEKARAAYDALTDAQKAKVDPETLKKLTDAEAALKAAEGGEPQPVNPTYESLTETQKKTAEKLVKALNVSAETAAQMVKLAEELGVSVDTMKLSGAALAKMDVDSSDPKGTDFGKLTARVTKRTNSALTLKWAKQKNADGYLIYGNKCGKGNKMKLLKTVKKNGTVSYTQKKLKKGTYYKYMVVAYKNVNGKKMPIAASVVLHAPTKGGKTTVAKSVKPSKTKVTVKKGKSVTVKATEVLEEAKLKLKTHRAVKFESSNPKIAKVNAKGKITGRKKGKATIYAYAQNGTFAKITVTVK